MEVEVIDDANKGVKQKANGRCKNPLPKRWQHWQEGMNVHVGTGTVAYRGVKNIYGIYSVWRFRSVGSNHIRQLVSFVIVKQRAGHIVRPIG